MVAVKKEIGNCDGSSFLSCCVGEATESEQGAIDKPAEDRFEKWLLLYNAQIREVRKKVSPGDGAMSTAAARAVEALSPEHQYFPHMDRGLVAWQLQRTSLAQIANMTAARSPETLLQMIISQTVVTSANDLSDLLSYGPINTCHGTEFQQRSGTWTK